MLPDEAYVTTLATNEEGGFPQHPFANQEPLDLARPPFSLTEETERMVLAALRPQTPREHLARQLLTPGLDDATLSALLRHFLSNHIHAEGPHDN